MAEEKAKKTKRPSAKKRDLQSKKNRLRNRSYKAKTLTAIRALEDTLSQKASPEKSQEILREIYSLMDKGVQKGIYKENKASRTKSRLSARLAG